MEDQREGEGQQEEVHRNRSVRHGPTTERSGNNSEPVRSRWTPKPEQILILESIFNSGMVNPPKEETIRIRKLLEKFGSVGDANVFYWFQNRRSRSRRRQRQMQAASAQLDPPTTQLQPHHQLGLGVGAAIPFQYDANNSASMPMNMMPYSASFPTHLSASGGSSSDSCANDNNMFPLPQPQEPPLDASALFSSVSPHISFPDLMDQTSPPSSSFYPPPSPTTSSFGYHSGLITVFINGVATEVPRGPMDFKTMFGQDVVLVHSSGIPLPTNDFGFLMHTLQHGESYFLVPKPT